MIECGNLAIADAAMKCEAVFASHERAHVGISGGADSDVMIDLCERVRQVQPMDITYDFSDTGIEYAATREHLNYLEDRYGVKIDRTRATKSIPLCCHSYGQPFVSKMVAHHMHILQRHGFEWDDMPLALLKAKYPDAPVSTLRWWSNDYVGKTGIMTSYCIGRNKWLREFIIENPPWFKISGKCCTYAKKGPADKKARDLGCDVRLIGTRKSEGGVRSLANRCFEAKDNGPDIYKPLYWLNDADKAEYCRAFDIRHSDCYEVWGFRRTGCVGCPFNRNVFDDLEVAAAYEPKMVNVARKVFADAYEYTRMFREFKADRKEPGQMRIDFDGAV